MLLATIVTLRRRNTKKFRDFREANISVKYVNHISFLIRIPGRLCRALFLKSGTHFSVIMSILFYLWVHAIMLHVLADFLVKAVT
jgi:hypothetical protein